MATFVIDTNKINNIKKSITNEVLPKVNTSYNTVVSVKNNLPSSVYWRKWLWTSLPNLYNDIENISEDVVKISDMLYKAIEKMDDAEARIKKWYKLKKDTVEAGKVAVKKVNKFKSRVSDEIDDAKSFLEGKIDAIYETGCEVVETVENYFKDEFLDDAKQFFETAAATVVVAVESLIKGLYLLLTTIVDLALIVGTVVITPFTALADGVNYLITGESGGYTKYYWDGTMAMVADVTESVVGLSNWFVENNPDWVNENSLIESGGMVDQIIQGVAYMAGIVLISVATFGAATPAALACTAGTLGFAKGTAEAWQEGKDAAAGLLSGIVDGVWEGFQYYIGGKIGTGAFNKIVGNIGNAIVQKLALAGIRISLDSLTGAVEVPFQSLVLMMDTRIDNIEGNEVTFEQAWEQTGGWEAVCVQTAIAGIGSVFGEVVDFGKAGVKAHKSGTSLSDELNAIYIDDLNNAKLNKENPFGRFSKNKATKQVGETIENVVEEVEETVENVIKEVEETVENVIEDVKDTFDDIINNDFKNNIISDEDIAMANYRAQKGNFTSFSFDDASKLPDLDSNFWKNIEHPEQTFIYVDGKNMTFDEALSYKMNYDLNLKPDIQLEDSLKESLNVEPVKFNSKEDISIYFSDPQQFVFSKLDEIAQRYPSNSDLVKYIEQIKHTRIANIDTAKFINDMYPFLSDSDKQIVNNMFVADKNIYTDNFSQMDKDVINMFTKCGGPAIDAYLRNTDVNFNGSVFPGSNKVGLNNYIVRCWEDIGKQTNINMTIDDCIKQIDELIENAPPLTENIVVYRKCDGLYFNNQELRNLVPGEIFNDKAYVSTSLINPPYSDRSITLEIEVPAGSNAAYIESITGVTGYNQQEFLIGRDSNFEITSYPELHDDGSITIKAKLIQDNSGGNITAELPDSYPNVMNF